MVQVCPLASSSAGCAYLVKCEGRGLLLDAGIPLRVLRRGSGFGLSALAGCLLTHEHGDHSRAVADLLRNAVDVYGLRETFRALNVGSSHRAKAVEPEKEFRVGDWNVVGFEVRHDVPCLAFVAAGFGAKLLYLTDTAYNPVKVDGLTHVLVEANHDRELLRANTPDRFKRTVQGHMSIERTVEMLKAYDLSKCVEIWLTHLSAENADAEDFRLQVQKATGCVVKVAPRRVS